MRGRIDRRAAFRLGAAAAAGLVARAAPAHAEPASAGEHQSVAPVTRAEQALAIRREAAGRQRRRRWRAHDVNGDESRHADGIACYGKGLPHTPLGEIDPAAQAALLEAIRSGRAEDFEKIPAAGVVKLVNPRAAFAFGLEGPDAQQIAIPPPPAFASAEQAAEASELYWQALTRDVPFAAYESDPLIARACHELSALSGYAGPRSEGRVTPAALFRGTSAADPIGPYISQFLWKEVPYGAIRLVPHVRSATPGLDYLATWGEWLHVQNGAATVSRHAGAYRYIRSARDLAAYVQLDFTYQPFLTACLILFGMEGTTDVRRPYRGAPFDPASPYRASRTQSGFATFGVAHVLDLVARVANLALRAAWFHKWIVHRRLRPEEFGGRLHVHRTRRAAYPLHDEILASAAPDLVARQHGSYLLPQAYPEGCPLHPSYPAGHAAIAGACATVLKAFFDESFAIDEPVVARPDGLTLEPYRGLPLTVGGELDKLASNVALGRNAAGIHWRSDCAAGLALGEALAIDVLEEMRPCFSERFNGFRLTTFDGRTLVV